MAANQQNNRSAPTSIIKKKLEETINKKRKIFIHQRQNQNEEEQRYEFQIKEEQQICDRAVKGLKEGSSIVIDWTTRSNFKVKANYLPKIKTQPMYPLLHNIDRTQKSRNSIELKRVQLAKLLYEKNKKYYLKSKTQQAQEQTLFGINHNQFLRKSSVERARRQLQRSRQRRLSYVRHTVESAQRQLLQNCKLSQLKEDLRLKFKQIRDQLQSSNNKKKRNSLVNL